MPVAIPVRSRPMHTRCRSHGWPCGAVAIRTQPRTAGTLTSIRVGLRPSQSRSTPVSRQPSGVAMVLRDAAERADSQRRLEEGLGVCGGAKHSPIQEACASDTRSSACMAGSVTAEKPSVMPAVTVAMVATAPTVSCCKNHRDGGYWPRQAAGKRH
jgi:hypothetical protein